MSPGEYILGFVAIIIGLAVADIAESLHRLLRARSRVRWHWYPFSAAFFLLLLSLEVWWDLAYFDRPDLRVTIGMFLPLLLGLIILYLGASASLPDGVPEEGLDLKAYYFEQRRYFWLLFAALVGFFMLYRIGMLWSGGGSAAIPALLRSMIPNIVLIGIIASLAYVRKEWWHSLWLAILPVLMLISVVGRPLS